ncbi:MAG: HlyD family efflux transporter periplasmic adaptor subunit [Symploca sp. SIO3C6]|nr:HlyD family efflux transporter periplasmic adaptor subunit [Symploca sp. SIO3C6]
MYCSMYLPFFGKTRPSVVWAIALLSLILVVGGAITTALVIRRRTAAYDVANLTVSVQSQPLAVQITASGTVQPIDTVNLSPRISDILVSVNVEQGDRVTQGQVIAQMKRDSIEAELVQSKARVAQLEAQLAALQNGNRPQDISQGEFQVRQAEGRVVDAEARLALALDKVTRNQSLYDDGAISRDALDDVLNEADRAQANLDQAMANVEEASERLNLLEEGSRAEDIANMEAQLQEARGRQQEVEVRLNDTTIRAPFSGIITQKYATEGAFVTPTTSASDVSSATSSAIVALARGLEVLAEVPEVDIGRIQPDQRVELLVDAYPETVFEGRVKRIAPEAVTDRTRGDFIYFEVAIALSPDQANGQANDQANNQVDGSNQLKSGMKTDVTFIGDELSDALVVPSVAIVRQEGQVGVLVPEGANQIRFNPVTLGAQVGNQIQILEGVESGDRVFVELPPGKSLENLNFGRKDDD